MNLTIIPGVLDVDSIAKIPIEVIGLLPQISTDAIVNVVNKFVSTNSTSSDTDVLNAVNKLRSAYRKVNELNELMRNTKARDDIEVLANLDYASVDLRNCDISKLHTYRDLINKYIVITDEDQIQDFIPKKDLTNLEETLDEMRKYSNQWPGIDGLIKNIQKYKKLFKDGQWTAGKRTIYARIYKKRHVLKNILRGIDFCLDRTDKGIQPSSWRIL